MNSLAIFAIVIINIIDPIIIITIIIYISPALSWTSLSENVHYLFYLSFFERPSARRADLYLSLAKNNHLQYEMPHNLHSTHFLFLTQRNWILTMVEMFESKFSSSGSMRGGETAIADDWWCRNSVGTLRTMMMAMIVMVFGMMTVFLQVTIESTL